MPYIKENEFNKYAIDTDTYASATQQLLGFMKGHRVPVTYFNLLNSGIADMRQNIADYPTMRNVINGEYRKIINYEITLPRGLDFVADPTKASVGVTGSASLYPGLNPNVGDIFWMGLGDGKIGVMQVSNVSTQSFRSDRVWQIDFVLQSFADAEDIEPLNGMVTEELIFDKTNFFGGTKSLLSEVTYVQRQRIKALRSILGKGFKSRFWNSAASTYIRSDGIYDESVTRFMTNKFDVSEMIVRPKIIETMDGALFDKTIWGRLLDRYNTSIAGLLPGCTTNAHIKSDMDIFVTELVKRSYVFPNKDTEGDPYVLSFEFYDGDSENMSPFELFLTNAIQTRKIADLGVLITNYLETADALDDLDYFYLVPLYIHLIDIGLQSTYREIDAPGIGFSGA